LTVYAANLKQYCLEREKSFNGLDLREKNLNFVSKKKIEMKRENPADQHKRVLKC
jgi:hypothetical protein